MCSGDIRDSCTCNSQLNPRPSDAFLNRGQPEMYGSSAVESHVLALYWVPQSLDPKLMGRV